MVSHDDFFATQIFYLAHENVLNSWFNGNGYLKAAIKGKATKKRLSLTTTIKI